MSAPTSVCRTVPDVAGSAISSVTGVGVRAISRQVIGTVYALALAGVVVGVDVLFFKHHLWERLAANAGLVLVFGAVYFRFFNKR
ncbi:MAG: hypothetical protein ACXVFV_03465 [Mycobacteriales bacterium]